MLAPKCLTYIFQYKFYTKENRLLDTIHTKEKYFSLAKLEEDCHHPDVKLPCQRQFDSRAKKASTTTYLRPYLSKRECVTHIHLRFSQLLVCHDANPKIQSTAVGFRVERSGAGRVPWNPVNREKCACDIRKFPLASERSNDTGHRLTPNIQTYSGEPTKLAVGQPNSGARHANFPKRPNRRRGWFY